MARPESLNDLFVQKLKFVYDAEQRHHGIPVDGWRASVAAQEPGAAKAVEQPFGAGAIERREADGDVVEHLREHTAQADRHRHTERAAERLTQADATGDSRRGFVGTKRIVHDDGLSIGDGFH